MFPWIVDIFDLSPYYFYKVIEIIIRAEEGLSRDVVKYLNHVRLQFMRMRVKHYYHSIRCMHD